MVKDANKNRRVEIDGNVYEFPTKQSIAVVNAIVDVWLELGEPTTPFSESGEKLMDVIIATWEDSFPNMYRKWIDRSKEYKKSQVSNKERLKKQTGRNMASIPMYIHQIMKKVFPEFDIANKEDIAKFMKKYPIFSLYDSKQLPKERF